MTLPELVHKSAEKQLARYCRDKVPAWAQGQVRLVYAFSGDCATLYKEKRTWSGRWEPEAVARFCYNNDLHQWALYYPGPEDRWRVYLNVGPSLDLGKLLRHLDEDPIRTFWA